MLVASRTGEAATRGQDRDCLEFGVGVGVLISSVTRFPQEKEMQMAMIEGLSLSTVH